MPYCTQCGAEVETDDDFCLACGAELTDEADHDEPADEPGEVEEADTTDATAVEGGQSGESIGGAEPVVETAVSTGDTRLGDVGAGTADTAGGGSVAAPGRGVDRQPGATEILGDGWSFLAENPAAFVPFAAGAVFELLGVLAGGGLGVFLQLVSGLFIALGGGVVIYGIPTVSAGDRFDLEALVRRTLRRIVQAIVAGIIWLLLVAVGLLLLILPGLYLMVRLAFVAQGVYLAEHGPIAALRHSWDWTESCQLTIAGVLAVVLVASLLLSFVPLVGQPLGTLVVTPIGIAALTRLYLHQHDGTRS